MDNAKRMIVVYRAKALRARRVYNRTGDRRAKIAEARAAMMATMYSQVVAQEVRV